MLYHYTTPAGLLGIAESKTLWATHIRYLNDSTEYLHAVDVARKVRADSLTMTDANELRYFDFLLGKETPGRDWMENHWTDDYFVVSLSKSQDRLSQWRSYAGRCGYCVGWDEKALRTLAERNDFTLEECIYDEERQRSLILPVLKNAQARWQAHPIELPPDPLEWIPTDSEFETYWGLANMKREFDQEFSRVATVCKHPAFVEEQEWRLVAGVALKGTSKHRQPKLRPGHTQLIPYVEFQFDLDLFARTPIQFKDGGTVMMGGLETVVYCGPNPEPALARRSVHRAFRDWHITSCLFSAAPYRDWNVG
ncbi:DUF2971 domain-containing protein [Steroidobacter flavus]|uniref:DUF2971 domain-containing protein n=1 Tax=Steroidobacter flavus TaxID=1842136 RepID=A0ABV8SJT8_9GAMM